MTKVYTEASRYMQIIKYIMKYTQGHAESH